MDHLDQATIDDNTTEVNLDGYAQLYDAIKDRIAVLHKALEESFSQLVESNKAVNSLYPLELLNVLNMDAFVFKSKEGDLSKEDIINLCNKTRDLSAYLFEKGYELLSFTADKVSQLNSTMVEKVPLYKLYRDIGMLFISTGLILSLLIGSHDQPLENVIFDQMNSDNTFGPEMMSAIQRYFASNEFMKSVFGIERMGDTDFLVEYGRIMRQEGKWKYQFQVNGVDGNVELWPTALFNTEHSVPQKGDEFTFGGFTPYFEFSTSQYVYQFDYPDAAAEIIERFNIEDIDPSKVTSIEIYYRGSFTVVPDRDINDPSRLVMPNEPGVAIYFTLLEQEDNPETLNFDGKFEHKTIQLRLPTIVNDETGLPYDMFYGYADIFKWLTSTFPRINHDD